MFFFSRATLNETFTAKYDGVLPRTPQVRPKSEIYTPRRDDEHPHPFSMRSLSPRGSTHRNTLFFFYKNIFYKNIEAEICEILGIF